MIDGLTKKELATLAGYSYRRLHEINQALPESKKLFVPLEGSSKCSVPVFVQRWVAYNVDHNSVDAEDLSVVKAKHEVIKTKKTELQVERMRGQLIDVQDVKRLWATVANTVMQNMLHLPSKMAPMLLMMDNSEQIAGIIEEEVRGILTNIAETPLPEYAFEDEEDNDEEEE